jgi:hypothetical protein
MIVRKQLPSMEWYDLGEVAMEPGRNHREEGQEGG